MSVSKPHSERPADVIREWFTGGSKKRWRTSCWHRAPDDVIAALESLEEQLEAVREALDKGRRFERAYQESLRATPTRTQYEILDSLQSAFLDAYLAVDDLPVTTGESGGAASSSAPRAPATNASTPATSDHDAIETLERERGVC